jgi:hypothetical protein
LASSPFSLIAVSDQSDLKNNGLKNDKTGPLSVGKARQQPNYFPRLNFAFSAILAPVASTQQLKNAWAGNGQLTTFLTGKEGV